MCSFPGSSDPFKKPPGRHESAESFQRCSALFSVFLILLRQGHGRGTAWCSYRAANLGGKNTGKPPRFKLHRPDEAVTFLSVVLLLPCSSGTTLMGCREALQLVANRWSYSSEWFWIQNQNVICGFTGSSEKCHIPPSAKHPKEGLCSFSHFSNACHFSHFSWSFGTDRMPPKACWDLLHQWRDMYKRFDLEVAEVSHCLPRDNSPTM